MIYVSDMDGRQLMFVCASSLRGHLMRLESAIVLLFAVVVRWGLLWLKKTTTTINARNDAPAGLLVMKVLLHCQGRTDIP